MADEVTLGEVVRRLEAMTSELRAMFANTVNKDVYARDLRETERRLDNHEVEADKRFDEHEKMFERLSSDRKNVILAGVTVTVILIAAIVGALITNAHW